MSTGNASVAWPRQGLTLGDIIEYIPADGGDYRQGMFHQWTRDNGFAAAIVENKAGEFTTTYVQNLRRLK